MCRSFRTGIAINNVKSIFSCWNHMMREKDQTPPAFTFGRVVLQKYLEPCANLDLGPGHKQLSGRKNSCRSWWSLSQFSPDRQTGPFEFHFESPAVWLWKIDSCRDQDFAWFCYAWFLPILYKSHEKSCLSLNRQGIPRCKALIVHEVIKGGTVRCSLQQHATSLQLGLQVCSWKRAWAVIREPEPVWTSAFELPMQTLPNPDTMKVQRRLLLSSCHTVGTIMLSLHVIHQKGRPY